MYHVHNMFMGADFTLGKHGIREKCGDKMIKIFDKSKDDYAYMFIHMNEERRKKFIEWYNKWNDFSYYNPKLSDEIFRTLPITDEYITELSLYLDTVLMLRCCPRRMIRDIWGGTHLEDHMWKKYLQLPSSVMFLQRCDSISRSSIYTYVRNRCKQLETYPLTRLPKDVMVLIFNLLSDRDLSNISRTSISMFVFVKRLWHKTANARNY